MTTTLNLFYANAASSTVSTANLLYTILGSSPTTNATYTVIGTQTGFVELCSQGATVTSSVTIGAPTGHGFLLDTTVLEGNSISSGSFTANIRLNASQFSGGTGMTQAGSLTADLYIRLYKRSSSGTYTLIVSLLSSAQSFSGTFTTYSITGSSASTISFLAGDKLYMDAWAKVTSNGNGLASQGFRFNRLTTDTTGLTGDSASETTTPGYQTSFASNTTQESITETLVGSEQVTTALSVNNTVLAVSKETLLGSEQVVTTTIVTSDPSSQMTFSDLAFEYARVKNVFGDLLLLMARTYYGNATNNQVIFGELDVILVGESFSDLHVMKTINDVNTFINNYS